MKWCLLVIALVAFSSGSLEAKEPSVRELQLAAERLAEAQPERIRSWLKRVNKAALLPSFKVRVGRGLTDMEALRLSSTVSEPTSSISDYWRFDFELGWSLDRLLFDRNELRIGREAQRTALLRQQLMTEVAELYFARRRLQLGLEHDPEANSEARQERELQIAELTAVLDGLTGGMLSVSK